MAKKLINIIYYPGPFSILLNPFYQQFETPETFFNLLNLIYFRLIFYHALSLKAFN